MAQGMQVSKVAGNRRFSTAPFITKVKPPPADIAGSLIDEAIRTKTPIYPLISPETSSSITHEFLIRTLDIVGSVVTLSLVIIPMAIVAILIKATSHGPVFYKQTRVGKNGDIFKLFKFRTMVNNAEEDTGPVWAQKDDSRVTPLGRFLRRTRIDELPQLFNVLQNHMSLVGPRPERPHFVERHRALQGIRLAIKPGITGLAQVRSYYDLAPKHKLKYDYLYIQRRSLLLNIYILLRTIPVLISKKGW
jgi:lipopolysaccharide/colanic/teichoic acid biosynthesis glycosyltransferase